MGCVTLVLTRNSTGLSFPKQVIAKINKLRETRRHRVFVG